MAEPTWIFCCGMQRSGSTLQFQLTAELVESAGLGQRVRWVRPDQFPTLQEEYREYEGWLVFKNHTHTPEMAALFAQERAYGIYVYRDLRDVFTSMMVKKKTDFKTLWRSQYLASCLFNYRHWLEHKPVLVSRYEQMIADLPAEVGRIAAHLNIPCSPAEQKMIAERYTLARQKERIAQARQAEKLTAGFQGVRFDPDSNLHLNHIHSGQNGYWRSHLTVMERLRLEGRYETWLNEHDYTLSTPAWLRALYRVGKRLKGG